MATDHASNSRKRQQYDDVDDEDGLFVSENGKKKLKSEVTDTINSAELEDHHRRSLLDPNDSADEAAEDQEENESEDDDIPYSEKQEPWPTHPAFDEDVPRFKEIVMKLINGACASLKDSKCDSTPVNELRRRVEEISVIPEHEKEMIGIVGDAGLGKSSLVNSLCDCSDLAKALDAGKSCTYVITKYQRAGPDQKLDFAFTVEFYDQLTIAVVLSKALDDWYIFHFERDDQWTPAEFEQHESKATTCLSTFRAIFSSYPDFGTEDRARSTLNVISQKGNSTEDKVQLLVKQAEAVLKAFKQADGTYFMYYEAGSTEDLWGVLDDFITEGPDPDKPAPWPLVKDVTVGVRGPRVLNYYILVDMPGISDTNEVRVEATQEFIKQCDHLVVVARASRVTTDTVVRSILQKYGKTLDGNIMIVCTKSDENVDHKVAIEMEKFGFSIGDYHALKALSDRLASQLKTLERAKRKSSRGSSRRNDLDERIGETQLRRQITENARWEFVVVARNAHNASRLRHDRQHHLPVGKQLNIFGVSNKHYAKLIDGEEGGEYQLSPEGTGVPELRRHLIELAAPLIWSTWQNFVDADLTAQVPGFKIWAGTGDLASGRAALVDVVQKQQQQLKAHLKKHQRSLMGLVDQVIISTLKNNQTTCVASAVAYVQQTLSHCYWATIRAFIKRDGHHRTPLMKESWNEIFTNVSTEIVEKAWIGFTADREAAVVTMEESLIAAVDAMLQNLRAGMLGASGPSMAAFEQGLRGHICAMRRTYRRFDQQFIKELRTTRIDATVDGKGNYFTKAMREAYEICRKDGGTGVKARCLGELTTHLSLSGNRSPFAHLASEFRDKIQEATSAQVDGLHLALDDIFQAILRDVKAMVLKKVEDPSEQRVRQNVVKWVEGAEPLLDYIEELMEEIKSRYPAMSLG